jgi:endoglycosylceramidase
VRAVALAMLGIVAACAQDGAVLSPATAAPTWSVQAGFLRDAEGRAVILRGANVSGKDKAPPWFDFHGPSDFARMRTDWGLNGVRFVMQWAAIEPESGVYDAGYLDQVAERVGWAADANLYVVLDMHQDVYGMGFEAGGGDGAPLWSCPAQNYAGFMPTSPWAVEDLEGGVTACFDNLWHDAALQAHYAEAWRQVAARLAGYDNVVGFDIVNEPYWGSHQLHYFEPDLLGPFYETIVPIVRSAAPGWVAFLEPSAARNLGVATSLPRPTFANYAYAPHSYNEMAEENGAFDPSFVPAVIANIAALAGEAQTLGGALWIGEYGGVASEPGIAAYMKADYDGAGAVAASSLIWDYTKGGYGLLDVDGSEAQPLVNAVVKPYPERVAGDPVSWAFDDATSTFTLTYHARASVTAPTIVSVPPRVYPAGYVVSCGGCASTVTTGSLTITSPPAGDPAVVTLKPAK